MCVACYVDEAAKDKIIAYKAKFHKVTQSPYGSDDEIGMLHLIELRRGPEPVAVERQVFDLLAYLLQNCDRVVSKDDLIASVWGGRIVSDSTSTSRVNAARRAVGDSGEEQKLIRTIARKGMCFVGDVHTQAGQDEASHGQSVGETRKIAAIVAADVVGHGKLAAADEERILARLLRAPQRSD